MRYALRVKQGESGNGMDARGHGPDRFKSDMKNAMLDALDFDIPEGGE